MDVAQDPEVSDQPTIEGEDRSAIPPNVTPGGWDLKEFAPVVTVEAKLSKDLVPLFSEGENVGRVAIERASNELHIAYKLLVADNSGPKDPRKVKSAWKICGTREALAWSHISL